MTAPESQYEQTTINKNDRDMEAIIGGFTLAAQLSQAQNKEQEMRIFMASVLLHEHAPAEA